MIDQQAASDLVFGKDVPRETHGKGKDERALADVILAEGTNVPHALIKAGWCWRYRKYVPGNTVLEGLETEARVGRKGLWVVRRPVPPWEWRKRG